MPMLRRQLTGASTSQKKGASESADSGSMTSVTLFLSMADLTGPATASGEVGNNRPEQRKRVIHDALIKGAHRTTVHFRMGVTV